MSIRSAGGPIDVRRLGTVDYDDAWQLQRDLDDAHGKQDRVLTVSLVLPPKSGRLPIASFCVEQAQ